MYFKKFHELNERDKLSGMEAVKEKRKKLIEWMKRTQELIDKTESKDRLKLYKLRLVYIKRQLKGVNGREKMEKLKERIRKR